MKLSIQSRFFVFSFILFLHRSCQSDSRISQIQTAKVKTKRTMNDNSAVILELFSSEGCSSCPPADQVLKKLVDKYEAENLPVFALKYHVDYWDRLGWKDVFASPQFSKRQYRYAEAFQKPQVYTPQIIINGHIELVGSKEIQIQKYIQEELAKTSSIQIKANTKLSPDKQSLSLDYQVFGETKNYVLNIALVEKEIINHIKKGENEGKILRHTHIVRQLETTQIIDNQGSMKIKIPKDLKLEKLFLILFGQNPDTMEILNGIRVNF